MILAAAACEDIARLKISNGLIIAGWLTGLLYRVTACGAYGIVYWLAGVLVPIFLLFILFCFRMIGAADIKIISVIGGFCGIVYSIRVFIAALFFGGILSVIRCIRFGYLKDRLRYFILYIRNIIRTKTIEAYYVKERDGEDTAIPFSAAIGLGFITVYGGIFG